MAFKQMINEVRACRLCESELTHGVRPIIQASPDAQLVIIGQAPGLRVHKSGIPWDDPSGDRLRQWLGIGAELFYGSQVAIVPMGFCYPGKGKSGDLPPRKECAPAWHKPVLSQLKGTKLTLLIGSYAQQYYLQKPYATLTETVQNFSDFLPDYFVLPHPSPRNNIWLKKNPWFEAEVLPALRHRLAFLS